MSREKEAVMKSIFEAEPWMMARLPQRHLMLNFSGDGTGGLN
jgi:hypothetical protein